jgi:prolyl 4-hydroxylase
MPKLSTIVSWAFYLVPIYILLISPALRAIFSSEDADNGFRLPEDIESDEDDQLLPGLNTTDDSFISPEGNIPVHCPGDDYRIHLFSRTPLIIYVENFVSPEEADHLVTVRFVTLPESLGWTGI